MRIVIPSVDYGDMLAATLPAWRRLFPAASITIATAKHDRETASVARTHGAYLCITNAWSRDGAAFNKARALDESFDFRTVAPGELCIAIDADVFPFGEIALDSFRAGVLYGCDRFYCDTPETLEAQIARPDPSRLSRMTAGRRGAGYFQAFRFLAGVTFGSYPNAGYYDLDFHRNFPGGVEVLPEFWVLHLGRKSGKNWNGRTLPKWGAA